VDQKILQVKEYLGTSLGESVSLSPYPEATDLGLILNSNYEFYLGSLLGKTVLFSFSKNEVLTPLALEKQSALITGRTSYQTIFVFREMPHYLRGKLIQKKIPFISLDQQLYLPQLLVDLRDTTKQITRFSPKIYPASQVLVLAHLLKRTASVFTANALAKQFGYTRMTMTRSIDELVRLDILERNTGGRYGEYKFNLDGKVLWEKVLPLLRSPVIKRHFIAGNFKENYCVCGEILLSQKTMLSSPSLKSFAMTAGEFKTLSKVNQIQSLPALHEALSEVKIELWHYDPRLLSDEESVDPLSLYLSLNTENPDERIALALIELLRGLGW